MLMVGRADVTKLIIVFPNFAKAPNENQLVHSQALLQMRNEAEVMAEKQKGR
jgi:hypothetical protein